MSKSDVIRMFPASVAAEVAYHDYLIAAAKARGQTVLHRPHCRCWSTWTESYRDPGCEEIQ